MNEDNKTSEPELKKAIFKTIAFFDLFDYPLTEFEVWRFLLTPNNAKEMLRQAQHRRQTTLIKIRELLSAVSLRGAERRSNLDTVETEKGFFFLPGREEIIRTRMERYNFSDRKFKRALRVARLFKIIPWIKMIAVGNLMGAHNLKDGGDIDLFIVTDRKRIWLTRFFCAGLMQLLHLRPKEGNLCDKICLSFFVSEEEMNLEGLMLDSNKRPTSFKDVRRLDADIYFIYWLTGLAPIYDRDGIYKKFIEANSWLKNYLPNWRPAKISGRRDAGRPWPAPCKVMADLLPEWPENFFKKLQLRLLPKNLKEAVNKNTNVVANDKIIKLHSNDRREEYGKRWREKVKN